MKRIDYQVGFQVDKTGLSSITTALDQVQQEFRNANVSNSITPELETANQAATELKSILTSSWNSKIGQLDFNSFNQQIKTSFGTVENLANELGSAGEIGDKAFATLAGNVLSTNTQLQKSNTWLDKMAQTMSNTVKWTIASSAMSSFTSSIQKAYNYVVDLDTSLNSIRIVSGQSADQMAEFAKQANSAAQALGSTTTDYTDAALIYYQQGLSDEEIIERTNTTIKMANVLGESASTVSDYMTAVWNNFDDGSQSLEYYGDVITALGAATASSADEIAEGLSKFSSVADTVGLSYEYATSALATVVAATRQSADTVGTAFKTIFARLEDLELGETLDDGTTLGSYSQALEKVGVNIKDSNGELKNMDTILDELAAKWETISTDEQIALAQSVAGTRQYTQLVSLMDNWDAMTENLETASNAAGTLEEQQEIYLDSIEAKMDQLQATAEELYSTLLDSDIISGLVDGLNGLLTITNSWISSFSSGLLGIGSLITTIFSKNLAAGINNQLQKIDLKKENEILYQEAEAWIAESKKNSAYDETETYTSANSSQAFTEGIKNREQLLSIQKSLTAEQTRGLEDQINENMQLQLKLEKIQKVADKEGEINLSYQSRQVLADREKNKLDIEQKKLDEIVATSEKLNRQFEAYGNVSDNYSKRGLDVPAESSIIDTSARDDMQLLVDELVDLYSAGDDYAQNQVVINSLTSAREKLINNEKLTQEEIYSILVAQQRVVDEQEATYNQVNEEAQSRKIYESDTYKQLQNQAQTSQRQTDQALTNAERQKSLQQTIQGVSMITSILNQGVNIVKTFTDESTTLSEKLASVGTNILSMIPSLIMLVANWDSVTAAATAAQIAMSGPVGWITAAVVVAGVAIAGIGTAIYDAYTAASQEAEHQAQVAEALGETYDNLAEKVETVESAFDSYKNVLDTLEDCTEGTEEWYDALEDVNNEALSLIDTLDEIGGLSGDEIRNMYSRDEETGQIVIDEDAVEEAINKVQDKATAAQYAAAAGDYTAAQAQNVSDITDALRDMVGGWLSQSELANGETAAVNALVENLDELSGLTLPELRDKLADLGIDVSNVSDSDLSTFQDSLVACAESADSAAAKLELVAGSASSYSSNKAVNSMVEDALGEMTDAYKEAVLNEIEEGDVGRTSRASNDTVSSLADEYLEASGEDWSLAKNSIQKHDGELSFAFDTGNGTLEYVTYDQLAATIAAYRAQGESEALSDELEALMNKLEQRTSEEIADGIENFISEGNFESMTASDFKTLYSQINSKYNGNIADYLQSVTDMTDEQIEAVWGSAEALQAKYEEALNNYKTALDSVPDNLHSAAKTAFDSLDLSDESVELQASVATLLEDALVNGNEDVLNSVTGMLQKAIANGELEETLDVINNMDWDTATVSKFASALDEAGIETDYTEDELLVLVEAFKDTEKAANDATSSISSIAELISDVEDLSTKDTISAEEYNSYYEALGEAAKDYFTVLADGTYMLTGSSYQLKKALQEVNKEQFVSSAEDYKNQMAAQSVAAQMADTSKVDYTQPVVDKDAYDNLKNSLEQSVNSYLELANQSEYTSGRLLMLGQRANQVNLFNIINLQNSVTRSINNVFDNISGTAANLSSNLSNITDSGTSQIQTSGNRAIASEMMSNRYTVPSISNINTNTLQSLSPAFKATQDMFVETMDTMQDIAQLTRDELTETEQETLQTQADLLRTYAQYSSNYGEEIQNVLDTFDAGEDNWETWTDMANIIDEISSSEEDWNAVMEETYDKMVQEQTQTLLLIDDLKELSEYRGIAEDAAYNAAWGAAWDAERTEDLDTEELEDYADYIQDIADDSDKFADSLSDDSEAAEDLAIQIMNMNDAIDTLADNWEDWSDILKKSDKSSEEYSQALYKTKEALQDLLDLQSEFISDDFVANNMDLITQAATGSAEAIDQLRAASLEDVVLNLKLDDSSLTNTEILGKVQNLQAMLDSYNLQVGASVNWDDASYSDFINACNDLITSAGLTADQVEAIFSGMGFETNFATEYVPMEQEYPTTITETEEVGWTSGTSTGPTGEEIEYSYPILKTTSYEGEPVTREGYVETFAMSTDGSTPIINSITKKASGSYNNYSSTNSGGSSPGSSSSSGGGSSSADEPDTMDPLEDEIDRYHEVDTQLELISNKLSKLTSQESKLVGANLIANLNQQLALLNSQIDVTQEKIQIAQDEAAELKSELSSYGVTYNDDGTISNYAAVIQAQQDYVNSLIAAYNAMSAEQQESYKEVVEQAEEDYENLVTNLDRYDEIISDLIPSLQQDIQDAIDEQIEIQIEKFNMEIEIRLDLAEAERDWNEFKRKVLDGISDEDILGNAWSRLADFDSYYKDDGTGIIQANTQHVNDILDQLKQIEETGTSSVYGDNQSQALEDLQTYYTQLMSDLEDIVDIQEDIHDYYMDMIDEAQDAFDTQKDIYESLSDTIEHDMKLIELVYGDSAYTALAGYYEQLEQANLNNVDFLTQQKDFWYEQMQLAEEGSEEWEEFRDNWLDAVSDWQSAVEDAVEDIYDKYLNTINEIFQALNDQVTSGAGLDYVTEEWELINTNADQYLDTINAAYQVQSLANKYLDAIDDTDSIAAQQKLNELMESEISALREKDELTQYDIDRAELRYQIALKQIALEEAQQQKTTLRLKRDSQGNYTYQYTNDDDSIASLQQEISDLYNELYNLDLDAYEENLQSILDLWTEYQEKMAEAAEISDPEERLAMQELLYEQYCEAVERLTEENETIKANLAESTVTELLDLYNQDTANYEMMTDEQKAILDTYLDTQYDTTNSAFNYLFDIYDDSVEQFKNMTDEEIDNLMNSFLPQWSSGVQDMADNLGDWEETVEDSFNQLIDAAEDYEQDLEEIEEVAGQTFESIADGTDETISQTQDLIEDNNELISTYENELDEIRKVCDALNDLIDQYNDAAEAAKAATEAAYNYWVEVNRQAAASAAADSSSSTSSSSSASSSSSSSSGSGSGSSGTQGDGQLQVGDTATYTGGTYYYDSYGTSPAGNRGPGKTVTVTSVKTDGRPYPIHVQSNDSAYGWLKKSQLSGYDTGGYTGEWDDSSGKIALLHQKELVLNADDTQNILSAVSIMRDVVDAIGSSVLARMNNFTAAADTNVSSNTTGDNIEQTVYINADFPNVEKSQEIIAAIENLQNIASQRVHS